MSQSACIAAVQGVWTANPWGRSEPVVWDQNTNDMAPSAATSPHWLSMEIEFAEEDVIAFGGGRFQNERRLRGSVVLRGYAQRGRGETTLMAMLDAAQAVFRSRRSGDLSFLGPMVMPEPGADAKGIWRVRTAIAPFEYRFRG